MTDKWQQRAGVSTTDEDERYIPGRDFLNGSSTLSGRWVSRRRFMGNSLASTVDAVRRYRVRSCG